MFHGFDPHAGDQIFVERRRGRAYLLAFVIYMGVGALGVWLHYQKEHALEVELEPEIKDFAVEEAPEPEPEEPPPPAPKNVETKKVKQLKPWPELAPPDKIVIEPPKETSQDKVVEVAEGGVPGGTGDRAKPTPKPVGPKPAPALQPVHEGPKIDPEKPVDRPEKASAPKPDASNKPPDYPAELRDKGITGEVVLKVHVHRDGSVRGVKILKTENTATSAEDRERANKLFKSSVIEVVQSWKYTPSKLEGEAISVWIIVNFPFRLSTD